MSHKTIHSARGIFTTGSQLRLWDRRRKKEVINFLIFNIKRFLCPQFNCGFVAKYSQGVR